MIRSRTRSSSRPGTALDSRARASGVLEALERQLRQAVERAGGGRLAQREDHRHRLRQQAPRDESERLHRRGVEPLRVVHQAQERALLGGRGEQVEHGDGDQEPVRGIARRDAQGDSERVLLRFCEAPRARRASARTTDGSPRTAAPSPPGRLRPRRRAGPTPAARRTAAARSFRCPARRGSPGRRSDRRAPGRACRRGVGARLSGRGTPAPGWQASRATLERAAEASADVLPPPPVEEREHRFRRGPADRDAALAQLPRDPGAIAFSARRR